MAGTSYTRQSTLTDGDTITASLFNAEYNQLVTAFSYAASGTTGHQHDGGAGEGGNIEIIGDQDFLNKIVVDSTNNRWSVFVEVGGSAVEQIRIQDGAIVPVTDSDIDLGTSSLEFKDGFFDGTIHVDTLDVDANATVAGTLGVTGVATVGGLTIGSAVITEAELETIDTITAGTVAASKAVVVDANKDITGFRNVTLTGELDAATGDFSGAVDIDGALDVAGTTNLDVVDIDGAVDMATTLAVAGNVDFNGDLDVDGTTNLDVVDIDGAVDIATTLTVGGNVDFNGDLDVDGTIEFDAISGTGSVTVTDILDQDDMSGNSATALATQQSIKAYVDTQITAEDLDITTDSGTIAIDLDSETLTVSGGTGLDSSATGNAVTLAIDSTVATLTGSQTLTNKSLTAPTLTGTATVASLDISGDVDVDGTLETDALTIAGVTLSETIADTVGAMVASNTETGIAVTYDDADNTLDFVIGDNAIVQSMIADDSIDSQMYVDGSIDLVHMSANSVDSDQYVDGSIDTAHIADSQITSAKIADGTIATGDIADDAVTGAKLADNIDVAGTLDVTGLLTADANVVVAGNLTVNGTTTTLNTATLDVEDKNITINYGAGDTSGSANGAGITIQDAVDASNNATILWDTTNDEFDFSHPINVAGKVTSTGTSVFASLDISGDIDVDGTTNLDVVDIDGAVDMASTLQVDGAATFTTEITANGGIALGDNDKATFGAGDDLQIYHTGSQNYIEDAGTGNLNFKSNGNFYNFLDGSDATVFQIDLDDATRLYHNTAQKLATTSGGISVTGVVAATSLDISGDIDIDGTTNLDVVDIDGAVDMASTLAVAGAITANAGVVVDNFTLDGTTLALSSGNMTLDSVGRVTLDSENNGEVRFADSGADYLQFYESGTHTYIKSLLSDGDLKFLGNDGGVGITALTLDMSAAGAATFSSSVTSLKNIVNQTGGDFAATFTTPFDYVAKFESTDSAAFIILEDNNSTDNANRIGVVGNSLQIEAGNVENVAFTSAGPVFNEAGADLDFRVESSGNATMLFVDGGNNRVGVGMSAPLEPLHTTGRILSTTTYGGATQRIGTSIGQNGNTRADIDFRRWTGASTNHGVGMIEVADTGIMRFYVDSKTSNTPATTERISLAPSGAFTTTPTTGGHAVFNEGGTTADFRVESNNNAHAIFLDGGANRFNLFGAQGSSTVDIVTGNGSAGDSVIGVSIKASDANTTEKLNMGVTTSTSSAFINAVKPGTDNIPLLLQPNGGTVVINENGASSGDFRVESNGNANMLFVDGGANHVNVGTATDLGGNLNVNGGIVATSGTTFDPDTMNSGTIFLGNVSDGSGWGANGIGWNTGSVGDTAAIGMAGSSDPTMYVALGDGTNANSFKSMLVMSQANGVVINEDSIDADFRVESNNNANMLFVDGGLNRVGIGTASVPANRTLQVSSGVLVPIEATSSAGETILSIDNTATNGRNYFLISGGTAGTYAGGKFGIFDADAAADRMSIDSSGNVTFNEGSLDSDFRVESNGNANMLFVDGGNNAVCMGTATQQATLTVGENQASHFVGHFTNSNANAYGVAIDTGSGSQLFFYLGGANKGSIISNSSGTAYNTSSDQRLKENIADADDAGSKIDSIQVRKFDWKADGSHQDYGMVAQELQIVAPEAVSALEDPDEMMGVDYSKLVPMLVKEIQTLRNRVEKLEKA